MLSGSFLSLTDLTRVDLGLNKSLRVTQTHLSCNDEFQTATSENCAAIYRSRGPPHLSSSGSGMALNLTQPEPGYRGNRGSVVDRHVVQFMASALPAFHLQQEL